MLSCLTPLIRTVRREKVSLNEFGQPWAREVLPAPAFGSAGQHHSSPGPETVWKDEELLLWWQVNVHINVSCLVLGDHWWC